MLQFINFFIDNWYLVVTLICAIILSIIKIVEFIGYPTEKKLEEIKERMLRYVTEAEMELGGKTGELKLAMVYDEFCKLFPYVKKWLPLEKFEELVDDILPTMRDVLEKSSDNID